MAAAPGATQVALTLASPQHAMFLYANLCPVHTLGGDGEEEEEEEEEATATATASSSNSEGARDDNNIFPRVAFMICREIYIYIYTH